MNHPQQKTSSNERSEFADSLRKGVLLGAAVLLLVLPPVIHFQGGFSPSSPRPAPVRLAQFGSEMPAPDVRQMANWIATSHDNKALSFVLVDKKNAKVYVFDPAGLLQEAAPALLGSAIGDDTAPGIGDKPLAQVLPEEKTTPAGRFIAEVGQSSSRGEDVVWVDYDSAVSMHRVLKLPERLKALASPGIEDNRMSFGCINLPPKFYESVLRPAVDRGAVIYVLPETRPLRQTFASFYDVEASLKLAQH